MKPILFNTDMVKAILEGQKTVTRRIFNPKFEDDEGGFQIIRYMDDSFCRVEKLDADGDSSVFPDGTERWVKPPYEVGDVLYVRETWSEMPYGYVYRADDEEPVGWDHEDRWFPSIHMPKEAARLFLRVTKVDIQRLNDMQEEDAMAEGFPDLGVDADSPLERFSTLWNKTIRRDQRDKLGWYANPHVWVIEFKRIEKSRAEAIEKVNSMTFEDVCEMLLKYDMLCEVCVFNSDCNKGVHGGPNGPIYPPCADGNPAELADSEFSRDVLIDYIEECLEEKT